MYYDYTACVLGYVSETLTGGGVDYDSGPYTVIIPAGERNTSLSIPINDDNIFEHNENFGLTVNVSSLPTGVYIGNNNETIITIVDNDGK